MTVQELFQSVDFSEFVTEYFKQDGHTIDFMFNEDVPYSEKFAKLQIVRGKIGETFAKFRTAPIKRNPEWIVFAIAGEEDGEFGMHSFCSKKEDILNQTENSHVEHYGYEFSPFEDILSYDVSEVCRFVYGDVQMAVAIFDEMTFFGIEVDERNETVKDNLNEINDAVAEIESGNVTTVPASDVFERLGWVDNRKPFEKEFDNQKIKLTADYENKRYKLFFEQEKKYLTEDR